MLTSTVLICATPLKSTARNCIIECYFPQDNLFSVDPCEATSPNTQRSYCSQWEAVIFPFQYEVILWYKIVGLNPNTSMLPNFFHGLAGISEKKKTKQTTLYWVNIMLINMIVFVDKLVVIFLANRHIRS